MSLRLLMAALLAIIGSNGIPVEHFESEPHQPDDSGVPEIVYFPETGQYLRGDLLDFWWMHGGVEVFGYPVTGELEHEDQTVQYFERSVLEIHPENDPEWQILVRRLGDEAAGPEFMRNGAFAALSDARSDTTPHEMGILPGQSFADYWEQFGGVRIFGNPISQEFELNGVSYQYFERAVFEYHPDRPEGWQILQLRLGAEAAAFERVDTSPRPKIASVPEYHPGLWPQGGPGAEDRVIYLTFDDGPHETWTPAVLDLLEEHGARATFFVLGTSSSAYPDLIQEIVDRGHTIANHGWDHSSMSGMSWEEVQWQLAETAAATNGGMTQCMRPPYGAMDGNTESFAAQMGYDVMLWDVDPRDWERPGAGAIAQRILDVVQPGDVVLLHDGGDDRSQSVESLELVLEALSSQGYRFEPICQ